ncbi:MAG: hypothetical protein CSA18_04505 [Deltaproteobacteria bacterium]|nr:MAG: hypothetical protein CSB21_01500 [Deltaproteobacteria bacterium]PIE74542.1 MAG: hypothetical protein CSA18_04505 [Deltaproteobacteria bacterium]
MAVFSLYICIGVIAGFLAGLLGIGGGLVIVPALTMIFSHISFPPEYIVHTALGTSLASIVFTSVSSMRTHNSLGGVVWKVVFIITPGIIAGTMTGAWIASKLSTSFLKVFFGLFLLYAGTQMLFGIKPKPQRELPEFTGMTAAGSIIGVFSSLVGIGGGSLSVPFFVWCNTPIHKAIGTSAAIGFPIAVAGSLGYILNGLGISSMPDFTIGFIHLKSLSGIVMASVLTAPLGAKLAHNLPVDKLKKIFAFLLYILGLRMILSIF